MVKQTKRTMQWILCIGTVTLLLSATACKSSSPASSGQDTPDAVTVTAEPNDSKLPEKPTGTDTAPSGTSSEETVPDASTAQVDLPTFSAQSGFYEEEFFLSLSSAPDCNIYYTTDGSDPRTSDTAILYTDELIIYDNTKLPNVYSAITNITLSGYQPSGVLIDKGFIIRATAKAANGAYSPVVTNSYFVGKTASYYSDMKVISMVTDSDYLFDPDTGAYVIGNKYYEWLKSDEYVEYDPGDVLNPTNYNTKGRDTEFPVFFEVFEQGQPVYNANVGARIAGNWSRSMPQKSFRFYTRKEYGTSKMNYAFFEGLTDYQGELIETYDKVTLRNGGNDYQTLHFRDALLHDLVKDLAPDYMESEPCILFLNGEFWGFYMIREKIDGDYIEAHYGIDKKDVAVVKNSDIEEGTEEDLAEFRDFCTWAMSADMTDSANYKKFCDTVDLQSFMDYMAVETYICNNDWANKSSNNWAVWHSRTDNPDLPKADKKWRFIFYDIELSTGLYGSRQTAYNYDCLNNVSVEGTDFNLPAILRNVCNNATFRKAFYDTYLRIIDTNFDSERTNALIDTYVDSYARAIKDTYFRFGISWAALNYEDNVDNLKLFFEKRPDYAKRYLNDFNNNYTK